MDSTDAMSSAANLYQLPNGNLVAFKSRPETAQFYTDIFEKQIYTCNGIGLGPGSVVFDVGANIGLFTLFVGAFPGSTVFAFEPAPEIYILLQQNVTRYCVAARLFNHGLGARAETREFTYYPRSSGLSSFYGNADEEHASLHAVLTQDIRSLSDEDRQELTANMDSLIKYRLAKHTLPCRIETLSSILQQNEIPRIDLLKIDVQKSELDVLFGIDDGDWAKVRQIAMEVQDDGKRLESVLALLKGHGYLVTVQQDELYAKSVHYNVYARATA